VSAVLEVNDMGLMLVAELELTPLACPESHIMTLADRLVASLRTSYLTGG
jgi:hypothetical protein